MPVEEHVHRIKALVIEVNQRDKENCKNACEVSKSFRVQSFALYFVCEYQQYIVFLPKMTLHALSIKLLLCRWRVVGVKVGQ